VNLDYNGEVAPREFRLLIETSQQRT